MEETNRPAQESSSSPSSSQSPSSVTTKSEVSTGPSLPPPRLGVLGRPTLRAPSSVQHAKETIMKAVDLIEAENAELRNINSDMLSEIEKLNKENQRLRKELEKVGSEKDKAATELDTAAVKHRKTQKDLQDKIVELERKLKASCEAEKRLKEEHVRQRKELDNMRNDIIHKEDDLRRLTKELESMHVQYDNTTKRQYYDRDFELLHEVEMLKNQKREWIYEKQELSKVHKKLENELKRLQAELESKDSVALKDSHVHGVLKREFNQLLEENKHLKLQLHRRGIAPNVAKTEPGNSTVREQETVSMVPLSGGQQQQQDARTLMATGTRVQHSSSQGTPSVLSSSSRDTRGPSKDFPLSSRERSQIARSQTFTAPSKEKSLFKRNSSFSIRDSQAGARGGGQAGGAGSGGRPGAASIQGRNTTSPYATAAVYQSTESLPSLARKPGGKGKG